MAKYLQIPLSIIYKCETCMLSIKHSCFRYFGNMFSYHILAQRWQLSQFILSSVSIHNIDEHMKGEGGVSSGNYDIILAFTLFLPPSIWDTVFPELVCITI